MTQAGYDNLRRLYDEHITILREALEFYATPNLYEHKVELGNSYWAIVDDQGEKARIALERIADSVLK